MTINVYLDCKYPDFIFNKKIKSLYIITANLSDIGPLLQYKYLKILYLNDMSLGLDPNLIYNLQQLSKLKVLHIANNKINFAEYDVNPLLKLQMIDLAISFNKINAQTFEKICKMTSLVKLDLCKTRFMDDNTDISLLNNLFNLNTLNLSHNNNINLSNIHLPQLTKLFLDNCKNLTGIINCNPMYLSFSNTNISNVQYNKFFKTVEKLYIDNTSIIQFTLDNPYLQILNISNNFITDNNFIIITASSLTHIIINGVPITFEKILEIINKSPNLKYISGHILKKEQLKIIQDKNIDYFIYG